MANDIFDNSHKETAPPSIPDKGINVGVTDTYGGGLKDGYQGKASIGGMNSLPDIDCCPGCDSK